MNSYSDATGHRLYRDTDRAVLGGVCAGLAGYFGLNLKVTRFLAVIAFLAAMPFAVFGYIAAVFLIPAESRGDVDRDGERRCGWGIQRSRRERRNNEEPRGEYQSPPAAPTIDAVRERYRSLDKRLAELEKQVTSPRFQLEQEFRKL